MIKLGWRTVAVDETPSSGVNELLWCSQELPHVRAPMHKADQCRVAEAVILILLIVAVWGQKLDQRGFTPCVRARLLDQLDPS